MLVDSQVGALTCRAPNMGSGSQGLLDSRGTTSIEFPLANAALRTGWLRLVLARRSCQRERLYEVQIRTTLNLTEQSVFVFRPFQQVARHEIAPSFVDGYQGAEGCAEGGA